VKGVMLDLETMGTKPGSAIVAIGAVLFDIEKRTIEKDFYASVSLESCMEAGLQCDPGTILWWMRQGDDARKAIAEVAGFPLRHALLEFATLFAPKSELTVWGNGADFDNVLLTVAYEKAGLSLPWKQFNNRCYRTIKNLPQHKSNKIVRVGTHHNALDDARSQALHLITLLNP
jgi:hypothetical protein